MVRKVFELIEEYYTDTRDYKEYVTKGSFRSALDIWRLIYNFRKDVSLYQVMNTIYELRFELNCQNCSTIRRRVFYSPYNKNPNVKRESIHPFVHHSYRKDEFGLTFDEWSIV